MNASIRDTEAGLLQTAIRIEFIDYTADIKGKKYSIFPLFPTRAIEIHIKRLYRFNNYVPDSGMAA